MRIGLLNWSGHNNIGDDAMAFVLQKELEKRGHNVINQGERAKPDEVDAYFWGGGTLISATGVWPDIPLRKPLIGFGIGVGEKPDSNIPAVKYNFDDAKMIFARDYYSYIQLSKYRVPAILSFDPVFLLDYNDPEEQREYVAVNIIGSAKTDYEEVKRQYIEWHFIPCLEFTPKEKLDFVYIDADHRPEFVLQDMEYCFRFLKIGGMLSGHDWDNAQYWDVPGAVNKFAKDHGLEVNSAGCDWWLYKK